MGAILREGWETGGGPEATGWTGVGGLASVVTSQLSHLGVTVNPKKDANGNGSLFFAGSPDSDTYDCYKTIARSARQIHFRVRCWTDQAMSSNNSMMVRAMGNGGQEQVSLRFDDTGVIQALGSGAPIDTSDTLAVPSGQWFVLSGSLFVDSTEGFVYAEVDSVPVNLEILNADTQGDATDYVAAFGFEFDGLKLFTDDIAVNDITLSYWSGTGTQPSIGDTITFSPSGSTAIVTSIVAGDGTLGTLQLHLVADSVGDPWLGRPDLDPTVGDTGVASGGWAADCVGLDPHSQIPPDRYIVGGTVTTDVAGKIQLTRYGTDSGSNAGQVDDIPAFPAGSPTTDGVGTSVATDRDLYEVENLATIGVSPGDIASIDTVTLSAVVRKDGGGLNNFAFVMEQAGTEYDSPNAALGTSHYGTTQIYPQAPASVAWDPTDFDALRIGGKFDGISPSGSYTLADVYNAGFVAGAAGGGGSGSGYFPRGW